MKRFIFSTLCVAVFFAGLGAIVQTTGAKFKSDEKALEVIRRARVAIGGDAAIGQINGQSAALTSVIKSLDSSKTD